MIHNHAFDAPAISLAAELAAPVVHTLHLPPDPAITAALGQAAGGGGPPAVACVSEFQAGTWREVTRVDAVLPPYVATGAVPWSDAPGEGAVFAGRLSPEKGAAEAIDIARAAGGRSTSTGTPTTPTTPGSRSSRGAPAGVRVHRGRAPGRHVGGHGQGRRRAVPGALG